MLINSKVTVYHGGKPRFYKAWVHERKGTGEETRGERGSDEAVIRIPLEGFKGAECGEYIYIGEFCNTFSRTLCRKVISVTVNGFGLNPHVKIIAV